MREKETHEIESANAHKRGCKQKKKEVTLFNKSTFILKYRSFQIFLHFLC